MISTSIAPWLSVKNSVKAVEFYKEAFNATEAYRLDIPDGTVVAQLVIDNAAFWVSEGASADDDITTASSQAGGSIRLILTASDPDALFARVLKAGATQIFRWESNMAGD